jgi:tellurite methyltransferase
MLRKDVSKLNEKVSWDERYASGEYSSAEPHKLLREMVRKQEPGLALDLACGTGRNSLFLAENGWKVTAVDNSAVGVEIARKRAEEKGLNITFILADLEKSEFALKPAAYDLICDFYYLQRELFVKMKNGVRPGGMIISTIHIHGDGEEQGRFDLREGELRRFFGDMEILHYHETQAADTDAGDHHRRTAELVARRVI